MKQAAEPTSGSTWTAGRVAAAVFTLSRVTPPLAAPAAGCPPTEASMAGASPVAEPEAPPVEALPAVDERVDMVVVARVVGVGRDVLVCLLGLGEVGVLVTDGDDVRVGVLVGGTVGCGLEGVGLLVVGETLEELVGVTDGVTGGSPSTARAGSADSASVAAASPATASPATIGPTTIGAATAGPITTSPVAVKPAAVRRPSRPAAAHTRFTDHNVAAHR